MRRRKGKPSENYTTTLTITELFHHDNLTSASESEATQNGAHVLFLVDCRSIFVAERVDKEADRSHGEVELVGKVLMETGDSQVVVTLDFTGGGLD